MMVASGSYNVSQWNTFEGEIKLPKNLRVPSRLHRYPHPINFLILIWTAGNLCFRTTIKDLHVVTSPKLAWPNYGSYIIENCICISDEDYHAYHFNNYDHNHESSSPNYPASSPIHMTMSTIASNVVFSSLLLEHE